jgi:hypothetical protein
LLNCFACLWEDPDPVGPKTYGSGTLIRSVVLNAGKAGWLLDISSAGWQWILTFLLGRHRFLYGIDPNPYLLTLVKGKSLP